MVVTQFGRIEFDPMRVPTAARVEPRSGRSFASALARHERTPPPDADPTTPPPDAADTPVVDDPRPAAPAADDAAPEAAPAADAPADDAPAAATGPVANQGELPSRGEPARRITADEGAGSLLESHAGARAPVVAAATPAATAASLQPKGAPIGAVAAAAGSGAAAAANGPVAEPRLAGIAAADAGKTVAQKAPAPGFRTLTPQALRLDDQARDSVFKQILFRLGKDSGEMRLRLDPPELGELDLHLVVEKGHTLRLSIATERQDLRDLLQGGLDQLKKELQQHGLSVAHAEVQTRQRGHGDDAGGQAFAHGSAGADDDAADEAVSAPRVGQGWVAASGLDYWV